MNFTVYYFEHFSRIHIKWNCQVEWYAHLIFQQILPIDSPTKKHQIVILPVTYEGAHFLHTFAPSACDKSVCVCICVCVNLRVENCILFSFAFLRLLMRLTIFSHVYWPLIFLLFNTKMYVRYLEQCLAHDSCHVKQQYSLFEFLALGL